MTDKNYIVGDLIYNAVIYDELNMLALDINSSILTFYKQYEKIRQT